MWMLSGVAWAVGPEVPMPAATLSWRKDQAQLVVSPSPVEKIAPDAPARLALGWGERSLQIDGDGALLAAGVSVADLRGATLTGTLEVSLCDLAGTTCRPTRWALAGAVPDAKKGEVALTVAPPHEAPRPFGPDATAADADAAFARAKASGKLVLLDFSAVWCPPCNQLAEEVLDADPRPAELDGYEVAVVDVDHASSFALKGRYHVGGYPTIVVVDANGEERTRTVGYPNKAAFLAWLSAATTATDARELALPPEELAGDRAAQLAWLLAQQHEFEQAEPLIARAEAVPGTEDLVDLHLARFAVRTQAADLAWLVQHAPERAMDYALGAPEVAGQDPEVARQAVALALRQAKGPDLAAALETAAALAEGTELAALFASGAVGAVRGALSGDPVHDKPFLGWHAALLEAAGRGDEAVKLLQDALVLYPDEPTVDLALSPLLVRLGRHEEAIASAERGVALSWGDNRLRTVMAHAKALIAAGRAEEGRAVARAELDAQPAPETDLDVRTHRYRTQLQEIADGKQAAK